jgi:hypothetical protein
LVTIADSHMFELRSCLSSSHRRFWRPGRLTKYLVYAVGVGVAVAVLGASLQPILAAVVIVGVVMVLALRGIADNFASAIVLQTRRPVQLGRRAGLAWPRCAAQARQERNRRLLIAVGAICAG